MQVSRKANNRLFQQAERLLSVAQEVVSKEPCAVGEREGDAAAFKTQGSMEMLADNV
jgi:hypothetical protein